MVFASRMTALAEVLSKRLDVGGLEKRELSQQLLTLSRFIDHAVASNQKPSSQHSILKSFKQFAYYKYDEILRPSIMVLMLSVKNACLAGWFKESDVEELLKVFKYLFNHFLLDGECWKPPAQSSILSPSNSSEMADPDSFISTICARYYPRLMLYSPVIVALTLKPCYEARGCDFQVTSQLDPNTKLRLFVCQKDAIGTSACLVTPPLLSFLVNGKGVERRIYLPTAVEAGPQLPSDVTPHLRIGCNFLQVLGECTANYFVAVVIMSSMPWSASSVNLEEYAIPPPSAEADDEVIVGHSRVSLRCPISHKRITTPAKGVSCRHHQAFDYDSYMEINNRRPSWRCPCCNGYVNCTELRLDRQMEQILREVDENFFDVMINHDGSWAPDVAADEIDGAHVQGIGQTPGDNDMKGFEEGVINVSDDEEDEERDGRGGRLVSPREPFVAQVSTVGTTSIDLLDVEDRKPDIRSMYISEDVVGSDATHAAAPVDVSNRDALVSPVMNSIYSRVPETLDQAGLATAPNARSVQILHGAARNTVQSPVSWPPVSGFAHSSSLPTGGQSSDSRLSPTESQLYPQPGRTSVIQALPAQIHYTNPNDRARFSPSVVSNNPAVTGEGSPDYDVQALHQQHQQIHNSDMADMFMMQELRQQQQAYNNLNSAQLQHHMDSAQRSQGQGQRVPRQQGVVQNGSGNVRDARTQQFAGSHQAGQGHQNSNQQGQQFQFPISAPPQPTAVPHQVQDYWTRQAITQRIQQHIQQASSSPRGSPGGVALGNSGSSSRAPGIPSGGSQQGSRMGSHPVYPGVTHSVANTPAGTSNSSTGVEGWVPPPQTSNWRSAGAPRMRGAIGGGSTAGMSAGVRGGVMPAMAQPGPVNRMRGPPPNAISPIPTTQVATTPTTMLWGGRGNPAGSELYSAPETLSTTPLVQDISWPTTVLESSQIDNSGPPDPVYWMDENMVETIFLASSPQGQSQLF